MFLLLLFCASFVTSESIFETNILNLFHKEIEQSNDNSTCVLNLKQYLFGLEKSEKWAVQMYDSSPKIPFGILAGQSKFLGSFDECLEIENGSLIGQYCLGLMAVPRSVFNIARKANPDTNEKYIESAFKLRPFYWSVCVPNSCGTNKLNEIFAKALKNVEFNLTFSKNDCQNKYLNNKLNAGALGTLIFFAVILITVVLSTIYDFSTRKSNPLLVTFSAYTNGKKILATNNISDQLPCLNGLKTISMFWIVLIHNYTGAPLGNVFNYKYYLEWQYSHWYSGGIIGGTVSVDTFLVIGGLLLSYGFMKSADRGAPFNVLLFYLHRFLRITPLVLVLLLTSLYLSRFFGSGPLWPQVIQTIEKPCTHYWWKTLIYVQNYVTDTGVQICIPHSWYLAVDMQLYWLSPLVLLPMKKWPKLGTSIIVVFLMLSIIIPFFIVWNYTIYFYNIAMPQTFPDYFGLYYLPTHTRFGPWLIGLALGFIIHKTKGKKIMISKYLATALWIASLVVMSMSLFGSFLIYQHDYNKVETSVYLSVNRITWSIGVAWIIFACVKGYGWIINDFLSLPIFQIFAKLCFAFYLTHYYIQLYIFNSTRTPQIYGDIPVMHKFWGDLFFSIFFAVILSICVEFPIINIDRLLFNGAKKQKRHIKIKSQNGIKNTGYVPS